MRSFSLVLTFIAAALGAAQNSHWARTYDLKHVQWKVVLSPGTESIVGDTTQTLRPLRSGLSELAFDCGKLTVSKVTVDGTAAAFEQRPERLLVKLERPASANADLKVRILYSGKPNAGMYFVPAERAYPAKTPMVYTQGEAEDNHHWLPVYDYPDDRATSEGIITVPAGWFALGNGALIETKQGQGETTYRWKCDQPHVTYLISLVAGPYSEGKETWDGIPISWYVPTGLEDWGRSSFAGTDRMVRFFSELTGVRYPYAKFAQSTVADFMFGGMENISAVTQTIGTLHPVAEKPLMDSEGLVLHELAHQWFGDYVTCKNWSHIWLNEGFASFLPNFYVRKYHGVEAYDIARYQMLQGAYQAAAGSQRPMVSTDYGKPMDMFDGNAYGGGAARMFMLLDQLGEASFWKGIRAYLKQYGLGNSDTEQFFEVMSREAGVDLDKFRQQWFYKAGAPKVTIRRQGENVIRIVQSDPKFEFALPIWILDGDRWLEERIAYVTGSEVNFGDIAIAGKPILVDPRVQMIIDVTYDLGYQPDDWLRLYRKAPNAGQKLRLIEHWQKSDRAMLDLIAREETSNRILAQLIPHLGVASADAVLKWARSSDRNVMVAAIRRLGGLPATEAGVALLAKLWKEDRSDLMRRAAVDSLASLTKDQSLAEDAWRQNSFQDTMRDFALNWWMQHDRDKAREMCLQQLRAPTSEPLRSRCVGWLGSLKDKPGERRVYEALARVVQEGSFGARNSAIHALAEYGDKAAIELIRPLLENGLFMLRESAQSAISRLGG